jgi:hypothetical protein
LREKELDAVQEQMEMDDVSSGFVVVIVGFLLSGVVFFLEKMRSRLFQ